MNMKTPDEPLTTEQIRNFYSWAYAWRTKDDEGATDLSTQRFLQRAEFNKWLFQHDSDLAKQLGWSRFGTHLDYDGSLEFAGEGEDGLPEWERPA